LTILPKPGLLQEQWLPYLQTLQTLMFLRLCFTGAMVTIFANITNPDVFKTVLLAAIGAAVSFVVTQVLKMLVRRMRHFK
jgi:hypothetical protein